MDKNDVIFVAGHRGLVGAELTRKLRKNGYSKIVTISHNELDLTDQLKTKYFFELVRPEYVIICAAKVGGIFANSTYPADFIYQNLMIESNIIHSSYSTGVKKLVNLGSSCIYPRDCPQPIKEEYFMTGPLEKTNDAYAIAKIAGVIMCQKYNNQYGTNFISLMPTNLYGTTCFSSDTEVLTPDGIKNIKELKIGDNIYTLNPSSHDVEIEKVVDTQQTTSNEMINFKTKTCDFRVTPDHKIYFKTRSEYSFIKREARIFKDRFSRGNGIILAHHKPIDNGKVVDINLKDYKDEHNIIRDYDDYMKDGKHSRYKYYPTNYNLLDFCKFIGWYVSEGSILDNTKTKYSNLDCGQIRITQSLLKNPNNYNDIDQLLKRMGIYYEKDDHAFYFTSRAFKSYIRKEIGVGSINKKIPKFVFNLPLEYRKAVFENLIKRDGDKNRRRYTTKSEQLKNDFIHLCFSLGIKVGGVKKDSSNCWRILYRGFLRNELFVGYKHMSNDIVEDEKVYCVSTEKNHIIYAGRNNKFNWIGQCDNYDPKNSHVLAAMIRKFHDAKKENREEMELWGTGSPLREFLHVSDLAEAIIFLMDNYDDNDIINVGSGEEISIKDLACLVKDAVGFEGNIQFNIDYPDGTPRKLLDSTKLMDLGWKPKIKLREGIKDTYEEILDVELF